MSNLLGILGKAVAAEPIELIWHWLEVAKAIKKDSQSEQQEKLSEITELIKISKLQSAEKQTRLYLFENPSCIYGRLAAAAICLSKNQLPEAIKELNSVYMRQPNNTMALYTLGYCYERLGREAEAIEFYQDCLKFKNYLQLPRQRMAAIYFKNGQLEKTIREYELLRHEYPDDISTLVMLGHLYIANNDYENAVEIFNSAILIHPDNFFGDEESDCQIDELIGQGQLHEALEQIEQLLQQQPQRADMVLKMGDVLNLLGSAGEATAQYEYAASRFPDFLEATIKLGTQYLNSSQLHLAAKQFNKAVETNDQITEAYFGLAIAQKLMGKPDEALATLSLASAIGTNSLLLFSETAKLQFQIQSHSDSSVNLIAEVIAAHSRQIQVTPNDPDLHYRLGVLMMSVGELDKAAELFGVVLELNPTYARAKTKLAACFFETGQKEKALERLSPSGCLDKDTLQLHYKIAILYCDRIKFASSLMNLDRLLENNFAATSATTNVSIALQNLGLLDRASTMLDSLSQTAKSR